MKTLSERLSISNKKIEEAYVIDDVRKDINFYDTFCLICAELNLDIDKIDDNDFTSCAMIFEQQLKAFRESDAGYTVSVMFD